MAVNVWYRLSFIASVKVVKATLNSAFRDYTPLYCTVAELRLINTAAHRMAIIGNVAYIYDGADVATADDGTTCIVSNDGGRFKISVVATIRSFLVATTGVGALKALQSLGADIASASTIDLDASTGDIVQVTGNVNISAITLTAGKSQWVRFTGTPTLVYGAAAIDTPGAADVVIQAGDMLQFRGYAASVVRVQSMIRKAGRPLNTGTSETLVVGFPSTAFDAGTKSSGTFTPSVANGHYQRLINNGAFTWAAPTAAGDYDISFQLTNGASAGAITRTGMTKENGAALTTTNGDDFFINIRKINGFVRWNVEALQ